GDLNIRVQGDDGTTRDLSLPMTGKRARVGIVKLRDRVAAVRPGGLAEKLGWQVGDRPVRVDRTEVRGSWAFQRAVLRPAIAAGPGGVGVLRDGRIVELPLAPSTNIPDRAAVLEDLHFGEAELPTAIEVQPLAPATASQPAPPSPAAAAGMVTGDRLLTVAGNPVTNFVQVVQRIGEASGDRIPITWARGDETLEGELERVEYPELASVIPAGLSTADPGERLRITDPGELVYLAFDRCVATTRNIFGTIGGMFSGSIDRKNLGGPILIAQVARRSVDAGAGRFLWILAILSINLMVLNSLPIPVLDGGQLALIAIEAVTGKPPKEDYVILAQWVGLILLLGLMVFTTWNDITR
ncbi:MAG: site-2 protease family protein, partial [Planctomycetota bacterium]